MLVLCTRLLLTVVRRIAARLSVALLRRLRGTSAVLSSSVEGAGVVANPLLLLLLVLLPLHKLLPPKPGCMRVQAGRRSGC